MAAYLIKPIARAQVVEALHRIDGSPARVLIVEDDDDMLRLLGRMIRSTLRRSHVWLAG